MATRRGKNENGTTTEATAEVDTTTEEAPVSTEQVEQTTENTEVTEASNSTTESTKAPEPDLSAFSAAVEAAVEAKDDTTGDVPEAQLAEVTKQYRALDGLKAKNAAKKLVDEGMKDAMNSGDLPGARAHLQISDQALVAASKSPAERVPADPTEAFVQKVTTLRLGYSLAAQSVPEGVAEDWSEKVEALVNEQYAAAKAYQEWIEADEESRGDEPEATAVVKNAVKLAEGRAARAGGRTTSGGSGYTGERRDIGKHIVNAFEGKEPGTFLSIADIRNTRSEEYGDNLPSAGAISARLFPRTGESTMPKLGIAPDTENGKKGARLMDAPAEG